MTDKEIADEVYIEPLTAKVLEQIILKEMLDEKGLSDLLEPRHVARELALEPCRTDRCVKSKVYLESF